MPTTSPSADGAHDSARALRSLYCGGREPLFVAAAAFSAGIVTANFIWRSPLCWLAAFFLAMASSAFFYRTGERIAHGFLLLAAFLLGAFYLQAFDAAQTRRPNLQAFGTGQGTVSITAHVIREGLVRESPYGGKQESVDVETENLTTGDRSSDARVGVRLTVYSKQAEEDAAEQNGSDSPLRVYTYGERLRIKAKLRMPRNYGNPGALDLVGYLASQNVRLTGSAQVTGVEVLTGFTGSRLGWLRSRARRSVLEHIQQLWPGERGALMQAMLIGGRAFFGREIKTDFQRTGTYHILVVSGINVGILAFALFWILRKLPFGETAATVLTILLSWGYAFVADLGSPIIRATITLNFYLLTRLLFRDRSGLNALGIAALGILLVNPRTLFEASFQLTFLSVIAVAGMAVPILRRTLYPMQTALRNLDSSAFDFNQPTRAAQFRQDLRFIRGQLQTIVGRRISTFIVTRSAAVVLGAVELVVISALIQTALTLPMAWYFHRATTMSLPANALVIPIASILLPVSVVAVALSYASVWLAYVPAVIMAGSLDLLTGTVRLVGHYRISDVRVPTPTLIMSCFAALTFVLALVLARGRPLWATAGLASLLGSALWIVLLPASPQLHRGVLEVTAIDVGQGDALLLVTPDGKTLLMDSGGLEGNSRSDFDVGEEVVSPYLWSRGIRRLDAVAISHAHSDHIGGMRSVIANFRPRELWYGAESPTRDFASLRERALAYGVRLMSWHAGDSFDFGGVHIRVLNPRLSWEPANPANDDESLVVRLQYRNSSALLVGDSHQRIEKLLIAAHPRADLLKIPHHGSMTSSSPEFLQAVHPGYAVVSSGFYNTFRHPRPEVMERYANLHITTYRTDLAGAVSFFLDGSKVTAKPVPR